MSEPGTGPVHDAPGRDGQPPTGRHIVLVGLPGAGKTTVGRALAHRLGRPFLDFDAEIVRREGRTVREIFASEGESRFRHLEAQLTMEAGVSEPAVIAPGGGWIAQPGLLESLASVATIVHLSVTPATALRRMGSDSESRPLLAGSGQLEKIRSLWEARRERYRLADVEVDTELLDSEAVADAIVALIGRSVS